jgi:hypothetical protein
MAGQARKTSPSPEVDFTVENYGSVCFVRCEPPSEKEALAAFDEPGSRWFGDRLAEEPRLIGGLVSSLREDGWAVR